MGEMKAESDKPPRDRRIDPRIDWALAESLFVFGETDDAGVVTFPSFRVIGERAKTTKENVQARCKRYNWAQLRADALVARNLTPPEKQTIPGVGAAAEPNANPGRRPRRAAEQIILGWIEHFDRQVRLKKVRADSIGDLDKAVRLLAFVRGEADSRKANVHVHLSLDQLQSKHARTRGIIDVAGVEVTGVLSEGGAGSLEGEAEHDLLAGVSGELPSFPPAPKATGWELAELRVQDADIEERRQLEASRAAQKLAIVRSQKR